MADSSPSAIEMMMQAQQQQAQQNATNTDFMMKMIAHSTKDDKKGKDKKSKENTLHNKRRVSLMWGFLVRCSMGTLDLLQ